MIVGRLPIEGPDPDLDGGTGQEAQHDGGRNAEGLDETHHLVGAVAQPRPVVPGRQLPRLR